MKDKKGQEAYFRKLCEEYLNHLSVGDLRCYGRFLNLTAPTRLKKAELIMEIVGVLCGEKDPVRTKRGAPIKNNYFKAEIPFKIQEMRREAFAEETTFKRAKNTILNKKAEKVQLQFFVNLEKLTEKQKQLLNDFLNSL